jgi:hypothetical protein
MEPLVLVLSIHPGGLLEAVRNCGFRALSDSEQDSVDAILYDADTMPAERISELASGKVPCIVIATTFDATQWSGLLKQGVSSILRRPIDPRDLERSLREALPDAVIERPGPGGWMRRFWNTMV